MEDFNSASNTIPQRKAKSIPVAMYLKTSMSCRVQATNREVIEQFQHRTHRDLGMLHKLHEHLIFSLYLLYVGNQSVGVG
jgi:hypothetical protein